MEINVAGFTAGQQDTLNSSINLVKNFDDFLTLLTTQLQNQDPLEPMDSKEFTNQLVAFAQVEQQINSNEKLDTLTGLNGAGVFSSALNYIGLDISYTGNELHFDGQTPAPIAYSMDGQPLSAKLFIKDSNGKIVYDRDLDATNLDGQIEWNGELNGGGIAKEGAYSVSVEAVSANEDSDINTTTVVSSRVTGVEMQGTTLTAIIGERAVPVDRILSARQPQTQQQTTSTNV